MASRIARPARAARSASFVVSLGIAEERHQPITKIFGDMPAESCYRFSRSALIARHRLTPFFGIELSGDLSRANQVAEEHRQMAPLACGTALAWFSLRTNRRGTVERRRALRAEFGFGWVLETALLTSALKRRRALDAELRTRWILR